MRTTLATLDRVRATRPSAPPAEAPRALPAPPIRLRFVLLFAGLALAASSLYPRLDAAWRVHSLATALANYGACMVGPTGPVLLRDHQLAEFHTLLRRRLVTAPAGDAPFDRCAPFARTLSSDAAVEQAHHAPAFSFSEFGGNPRPTHSLAELNVSPETLAHEARRAWPFVRSYAALVKPSLGVKEAPHPVAPPAPALGRGLTPARAYYRAARVTADGVVLARGAGANLDVWKSTDGGATFKPASAELGRDFAERCSLGSDGKALTLQSDAEATRVISVGPSGAQSAAVLAKAGENVVTVACDERVLVAAVRAAGSARATLEQCSFGAPCSALPSPSLGRPELGLDYPLDLARVAGATVLALRMGNIVRVTSSRDGVSWTPLSVAYDGGEQPLPPGRMPTELLTIGKRVLLHGSALRANDTYGLLYSDDQGASFRGR
jgi:hypothetical protein